MAQVERRPGDEDRDMNRRATSHIQIRPRQRSDSQDDNAEENSQHRNAPRDSLHPSVQLPFPVMPNLSRGQGSNSEDDSPDGEEPQVIEVQD